MSSNNDLNRKKSVGNNSVQKHIFSDISRALPRVQFETMIQCVSVIGKLYNT